MRKATIEDLDKVQALYADVVTQMHKNNLFIWNDQYPSDYLATDIKNGQLFLNFEGENLIGAFSLCIGYSDADPVGWQEPTDSGVYLNRFVIHPNYLRKGYGKPQLEYAKTQARALKGNYLRLYAVDCNTPAIEMYLKYGFVQVEGCSTTDLVKGKILNEYGFEMKL